MDGELEAANVMLGADGAASVVGLVEIEANGFADGVAAAVSCFLSSISWNMVAVLDVEEALGVAGFGVKRL